MEDGRRSYNGPVRDGDIAARQYDAMSAAYRVNNEERAFNAYYERPATIALLGDVTGLRVLEAGCGPGVLTEWLAGHGAAVTAVDVSPEMVRLAQDRVGARALVRNADLAEPLDVADASVDLIVASLVLHYLADWDGPLAEFHRVLTPGGAVVFSTHHPAMDWQLHSPADYFATKQVTESWQLGAAAFEVTFWRRPLTAITEAISRAGFVIDRMVEPEPRPELRQVDPDAYHRLRTRPAFLFFRLTKGDDIPLT
jgi:ubiquinone/menaquinone biosynthesis C-methylase UbiE